MALKLPRLELAGKAASLSKLTQLKLIELKQVSIKEEPSCCDDFRSA